MHMRLRPRGLMEVTFFFFYSFTLHPAHSMVGMEPWNLVLKYHSVPIKTLPFPNFRQILETLRIVTELNGNY